MNVAFHALCAVGLTHAASTRMRPEGRAWRLEPGDGRVLGAGFVLAVMSHGVLDGLKHYYPLSSGADTVVSAALVLGWAALLRPRFRLALFVSFLGAILPDIVDHVPRDLNRHLGLGLPLFGKIFPWHWPVDSGSIPGRPESWSEPAAIASLANHVIVVSFVAAMVAATRGALRPWRATPTPG